MISEAVMAGLVGHDDLALVLVCLYDPTERKALMEPWRS
jgi:hypothetical protein